VDIAGSGPVHLIGGSSGESVSLCGRYGTSKTVAQPVGLMRYHVTTI
jgi:hypothetical protein